MTEDTKRALARHLAGGGALAAFLAVMAAGLIMGGVYWGEVTFWLAFFAAVALDRLGTMRSTKGRWL